jgi:PAS domain S-box-containing protein
MMNYLLSQQYLLFNKLLDAIPYPIVAVDHNAIIWLYNQAFSDLIPNDKDNIINRHINTVVSNSQLHKTVVNGKVEKWQTLKIDDRSFLVNRSPLIINQRNAGAVSTLHDVSELEQISNELKSVRTLTEELHAIIEASFDGIYVTDGTGKTIRINKAYERITGLRGKDVIGFTMQELVDQNVFDQSTTLNVLATGTPCTLFQKIKNGGTVLASGTPVFDNGNNIVRVVTTVRDLTELNQLQDQLNTVANLNTQYQEELRELKHKLYQSGEDEVIAHSIAMQRVMALALRLSSVDSTALIQGESGVGKEVIASIIHHNSRRKNKPFIKINCAAIPETLLESELFGYVHGAFTGANRGGRRGLFEAAEGGTLLLDEIGDLSMSLQAKLLRVLQERQILRLGDDTPRSIDVRILAATNKNLASMIQDNSFRQDLYYRLNVIPIEVPPLRERKEDIMFMTQAFLKKFCLLHNRKKELHPQVMPMLLAYDWPGNVRELENIIERLVATSPGTVIRPEDLPSAFQQTNFSYQLSMDIGNKTLKEIMDSVEYRVMQMAFSQHKSTRKVAMALGIVSQVWYVRVISLNFSRGISRAGN